MTRAACPDWPCLSLERLTGLARERAMLAADAALCADPEEPVHHDPWLDLAAPDFPDIADLAQLETFNVND